MKKELFEQLKRELVIIAIMFVLILTAFKIIFVSESFFVVSRTVLAIFWLIFLPGYALTFYWIEKLKLYERLIIGIAISTAIMGLLSYYLGLLGLHIKFHSLLLPIILIFVGIMINLKELMQPKTSS